MSSNIEEIIDRRRLRKKVSFWRITTFVILALALLAMIGFGAQEAGLSATGKDHIARVKISGVIINDEPMLKLLEKIRKEERRIFCLPGPG